MNKAIMKSNNMTEHPATLALEHALLLLNSAPSPASDKRKRSRTAIESLALPSHEQLLVNERKSFEISKLLSELTKLDSELDFPVIEWKFMEEEKKSDKDGEKKTSNTEVRFSKRRKFTGSNPHLPRCGSFLADLSSFDSIPQIRPSFE